MFLKGKDCVLHFLCVSNVISYGFNMIIKQVHQQGKSIYNFLHIQKHGLYYINFYLYSSHQI